MLISGGIKITFIILSELGYLNAVHSAVAELTLFPNLLFLALHDFSRALFLFFLQLKILFWFLSLTA